MERRDFFISYTKKDTEQAVWIAKVLKSHGYTVYIQQLDIKPGDNFLEKMNEFLKNGENFLVVWSKAYSKSRFCMTEMQAAFNEWHKRRINGFLPVRIEDYPMEPLYAAMVHADLFGMNKASAEKNLMDAVRAVFSHTETKSNIPIKRRRNKYKNTPQHFIVKPIVPLIMTIALIFISTLVLHKPIGLLQEAHNTGAVTEKRELSDAELYQMGRNYHLGQNGVDVNYTKAREYYERAAEKGNSNALNRLGQLYQYGYGVDVNYTKAREYYEQAAEKGNSYALNNLGQLYHNEWGVPRDYTIAREYYERAAKDGNEFAMYNLGTLYEHGQGVMVNYPKAIEYYQQAYDKGYKDAAAKVAELREKLYG